MPPSECTTVLSAPAPARRGRPAILFDNRRVQTFMSSFDSYLDLIEAHPLLEDVFTGASRLQTEGEDHDRPLRRARLFYGLQANEVLTSASFSGLYSRSASARYFAAARVISRQTSRLLDQHPAWEGSSNYSPLY